MPSCRRCHPVFYGQRSQPVVRGQLRSLKPQAAVVFIQFGDLRAHYDEAQVLEIIQLCGFYRMVSYMANALALPLEAKAARFPTAA